ncbi:MAG TPA: CvpA family protein [Armatimonadota bacterium]|jgi:uncharacterized membrane protein required for colicin V production
MVTWVDAAIVVLLLAVVILEIKRGFGQAVFDVLALVVTMRLSFILVNPVDGVIKVAAETPAHQGLVYLVVFIVTSIIALFIGHMIYNNMLFTADAFEAALGGVLGVVVGVILCHVLVTSLNMMGGADDATNVVKNSRIAPEFLEFTTYHRLMDFLYHFNK